MVQPLTCCESWCFRSFFLKSWPYFGDLMTLYRKSESCIMVWQVLPSEPRLIFLWINFFPFLYLNKSCISLWNVSEMDRHGLFHLDLTRCRLSSHYYGSYTGNPGIWLPRTLYLDKKFILHKPNSSTNFTEFMMHVWNRVRK